MFKCVFKSMWTVLKKVNFHYIDLCYVIWLQFCLNFVGKDVAKSMWTTKQSTCMCHKFFERP